MKEYSWDIEVNGEMQNILVVSNIWRGYYHLYANDELVMSISMATNLYQELQGGIQREVIINGVPLLFMEYNGKPQLVIDGVMFPSGKAYEVVEEVPSKKLLYILQAIMFLFTVLFEVRFLVLLCAEIPFIIIFRTKKLKIKQKQVIMSLITVILVFCILIFR